jgi:hypothetical protein
MLLLHLPRYIYKSIFTFGIAVIVTGCGGGINFSQQMMPTGNGDIRGIAMGGQQPVANALITIYKAGTSGYDAASTQLAQTTTDGTGYFTFPANSYSCVSTEQAYIMLQGGNPGGGTNSSAVLMAALGSCSAAPNLFIVKGGVKPYQCGGVKAGQ